MSRNPLLGLATAALAGLIFGLGLAFSQMTVPDKVKDFLDIASIATGAWDPSLIFVMGTGVVVMFVFYRIGGAMPAPLLAADFASPTRAGVDRPLVVGSAVFGIGWGLSGLCPGPAIADLGVAPAEVALFVVAMLVGSWGMGLFLSRPGGLGRFTGGEVPAE